ncbi:MAG: hypothetical protein NUW12_02315 [Firmicutes bacterium]|nr:hypothetical protein [Bacillota bacterium]MDH7494719.1 hypothetical protein [Bacillota bacterium]
MDKEDCRQTTYDSRRAVFPVHSKVSARCNQEVLDIICVTW